MNDFPKGFQAIITRTASPWSRLPTAPPWRWRVAEARTGCQFMLESCPHAVEARLVLEGMLGLLPVTTAPGVVCWRPGGTVGSGNDPPERTHNAGNDTGWSLWLGRRPGLLRQHMPPSDAAPCRLERDVLSRQFACARRPRRRRRKRRPRCRGLRSAAPQARASGGVLAVAGRGG